MGRAEKYLIGDRFSIEEDGSGHWYVTDSKGELHEIFDEDPVKIRLIYAYKVDDVYWILEKGPLLSSDDGVGNVVIKGNEVISYGVLEKDNFYINHYEQEFKVKIKVGERTGILINGKDIEVRKKDNKTMEFKYAFLGTKLTPMIEVEGGKSEAVCFPEFNKVYSGRELRVYNCWGCSNVWVLKNNMLYFYLLFENGEEYLGYEGPTPYTRLSELPELHMMGNIMVVYFYGRENEIVHNLRRIPGFAYMYVRQDFFEGNLYISFDLKGWEEIGKVGEMIFKGDKIEVGRGTLHFHGYYSMRALENLAKKILDHKDLSLGR